MALRRDSLARTVRALALICGAVTLLGGTAITLAPTASAHSALTGSDPAEGAIVDAPPAVVTLTFNEDIIEVGTEAVVVGNVSDSPAGTFTAEGTSVTVDGKDVKISLPDTLPAASYTVTWRAVSSDGHPIEGVLNFTASGPGQGWVDPASASATADSTTEPTAVTTTATPAGEELTATPFAAEQTSDATPAVDSAGQDDSSGISGAVIVAVIAIVALVAVGITWLFMRRRRQEPVDLAQAMDDAQAAADERPDENDGPAAS